MMTTTWPFEHFMHSYQNLVLSTATRLLGNPTEAQDIAQEVFLKAYQRYPEVRQGPCAGGWLRTVTRNMCLNYLNRYRGRWRFFSELSGSDPEEDFAASVPAPNNAAGEVMAADQKRQFQKVLADLPDAQRAPLMLFHFEDLDYREIATRLGLTMSQVKNNIFRGRRALRRKLAGQA
jgi:RNA polymerase sigma-70 factor, ECF subfamily